MMRILAALLLTGGVLALDATAHAQDKRPITLQECLQLALRQNVDLVITGEEVKAAAAQRASARGNFGPRLRAEANILRWNGPFSSSFMIPGTMGGPSLTIREAVTSTVTLTAMQPVSGLWGITEGYRLRDLGLDATKLRQDITQRDLAFQVTEAFYRLLQAERLVEVAGQSVAQLDAQARRAQVFETNGIVGRNDVLRAQLGLGNARLRSIQARGAVTIMSARLAVLIGLPLEGELSAVERPGASSAVETPSTKDALGRALRERAEVRELDIRLAQARVGTRAAWAKLLPQINAVLSYQHNEGTPLAQRDAFYVGGVASWDFWDWGANYFGVPEARARQRQAVAGKQKVQDGIRLEVQSALVTVHNAREALDVARQAVTQAEENFRIESKKYESHANTSFDVLDAETLLTQARAQLLTNTYDVVIAEAGLLRSMGGLLEPAMRLP